MRSWRRGLFDLGRLVLPVALALGLTTPHLQAQQPKEVKVGLIVPLSGLYARPGAVMRMGAEMAIERINLVWIKALGS
jgi:branched-chain amino acid transport system substrate-binding protein